MKLAPLLLAFALLSLSVYSHYTEEGLKCSHDSVDQNHEIVEIDEDVHPEGERLLQELPQFRMAAGYDALDSAPASYKEYMQTELVPPVLDYFQAALKIKRPLTSKITISASKVCSVPTPAALKSGVVADFFVILDSAFDDASSWVAESYSCYLASGTKRPYIGKTVFNRDLLKEPKGNILLHEKNTYLFMHELIHTLGFSKSLYKYYLDVNGKVIPNPTKTVSLLGVDRMVLDIPVLTERARNYFGCSNLEGVFLEDDGSSASYGSHLERRYFVMEHMTSGLMYTQRISEFTLGVLEATGWFVPDFSMAEPYYLGQGKGCGFFRDSCSASSFDYEEYGYCKGSTWGCGTHGRGGGKCVGDTKSDNCRYTKPDVNYDCENPNADNYVRLPSLQTFGREAGSKCFTGTLSSTSSSASTTSFCFKPTCSGSGSSTKLVIKVGSQSVTCTKEGKVSVSGYRGTIDCPDPLTFCSTIGKPFCPRGCMGRGKCVNNKCECNKGFGGVDCGLFDPTNDGNNGGDDGNNDNGNGGSDCRRRRR